MVNMDNRIKDYAYNDALAALIASTKRINRKLNLIEIANKIKIVRNHLGNLKEVARVVGLSSEMVRSFTRVNSLDQRVRQLIKTGDIKSIDIADRLSRLPFKDQYYVAKEAAKGHLTSHDMRAIVSLRKTLPKASILNIVSRIRKSKNIKEYIAEFVVPQGASIDRKEIFIRLKRFFGAEHVQSYSIIRFVGRVVLDEIGKNNLMKTARIMQITKGRLLQLIIEGEVNAREQK